MPKNTPVIKDWFVLGLTTGFVACVAKNLVLGGIERLGLPTIRYDTMAGGLIMGKRAHLGLIPSKLSGRKEWLVGSLADWTLGSVFGVMTAYVHTITPPGNNLIKGALGGAAWWMGTITVGQQLKLDGLVNVRPEALVNSFVVSVVYGMSQGWAFGRFGSKLITQSHPQIVRPMTTAEFDQYRMRPDPDEPSGVTDNPPKGSLLVPQPAH